MFDNAAIDVCTGLIFIYLLYSLLATVLQEMAAQWFNMRARNLIRALRRMLQDEQKTTTLTFNGFLWDLWYGLEHYFAPFTNYPLLKAFYDYPLIKYLGENHRSSKPSYIAPRDFAETMIHLLTGDSSGNNTNPMQLIQTNLLQNNISGVKAEKETLRYLKKMANDSAGDIEKFRSRLEDWFNSVMDRSSGWYKRETQSLLFLWGLIFAIVYNVNTIRIAHILIQNGQARQQLAALAASKVTVYNTPAAPVNPATVAADQKATQDQINKVATDMAKVNDILGSSEKSEKSDGSICQKQLQQKLLALAKQKDVSLQDLKNTEQALNGCLITARKETQKEDLVSEIIGRLLTALAISLGAPFWFDLLNKIVTLRSTGPKQGTDSNSKNSTGSPQIKPVG